MNLPPSGIKIAISCKLRFLGERANSCAKVIAAICYALELGSIWILYSNSRNTIQGLYSFWLSLLSKMAILQDRDMLET